MNTETTWVDDESGFEYRITYTEVEGRLAGIAVESDHPTGLQLALMRRIPHQQLLTDLRRARVSLSIPDGTTAPDAASGRQWTAHGDGIQLVVEAPPGSKIKRETIEGAVVVARIYNAMRAQGSTRGYREVAAEQLYLSVDRISQLRREAEALGLIKP
jgi:hypothetical protein